MKASTPATHCNACAVRHTCVFYQLGDAERAALQPYIRQRIFHRGEPLTEEGEMSHVMRVLKLGKAIAYRRGLDGHPRPVGLLARGNAVGFFAAFQSASPVSCVAITTARVCEIPASVLIDVVPGNCVQRLALLTRVVVGGFAALATWSEAMRLPDVVNRLAYVVMLLADENKSTVVELPSQAGLAELLGTRRESIARALQKLKGEGGIRQLDRRRFEVHRTQLLARVSQPRAKERK